MILPDDVWSDDEFPVFMCIKPWDEDIFIGLPARTSHKCAVSVSKCFHHRQLLGSLFDLQHAVKAGIANHGHLVDANLCQQLSADLVLHEEVGKAVQYASVATSIPLEEHLFRSEDARHTIYRHLSVFEDVQVVVPKLILDEECHDWTYGTQETACIHDRVKGQIGNDICAFIVFAHLIARRREERQQNLIFRMFTLQLFHERTPLFKLTQRCSMKPYILRVRIHFLLDDANGPTFSTPHIPHLFTEKRGNDHTNEIDINDDIIHK